MTAQKIFITEAEHFVVPGRPMTAHSTRFGAVARAVELTNIMLGDLEWKADATAENWQERMAAVKAEREGDTCYVEITELELRS